MKKETEFSVRSIYVVYDTITSRWKGQEPKVSDKKYEETWLLFEYKSCHAISTEYVMGKKGRKKNLNVKTIIPKFSRKEKNPYAGRI